METCSPSLFTVCEPRYPRTLVGVSHIVTRRDYDDVTSQHHNKEKVRTEGGQEDVLSDSVPLVIKQAGDKGMVQEICTLWGHLKSKEFAWFFIDNEEIGTSYFINVMSLLDTELKIGHLIELQSFIQDEMLN